ncbi:hypothetical protein, partial [Methylobacterium trifolii]|uniref:hypothetical protein n=1 Tax=Methylobacterium trifolii TaxID=1003092 RepID=UPI001EDF202B
ADVGQFPTRPASGIGWHVHNFSGQASTTFEVRNHCDATKELSMTILDPITGKLVTINLPKPRPR